MTHADERDATNCKMKNEFFKQSVKCKKESVKLIFKSKKEKSLDIRHYFYSLPF